MEIVKEKEEPVVEKKQLFVAEVKTVSPDGWKSQYDFPQLLQMALEIGDIISIHTCPLWGGSLERLNSVSRKVAHNRSFNNKKILAKGIHQSKKEVLTCVRYGADYVLTIDYFDSELADVIWVEPSSWKAFLDLLPRLTPDAKVVWNSRKLFDSSWNAKNIFIGDSNAGYWRGVNIQDVKRKFGGFVCQASGIEIPQHVAPEADAFIVGKRLPYFYLNHLLTRKIEG